MSETTEQTAFDFDRAGQLGLLGDAPIESGHVMDGKTPTPVKGSTARNVLRRIDAYARKHGFSWVSAKSLAAETGLSVRTIRRSVRLLEGYEYLIVERPSGRSMRCRINWGELGLRTSVVVNQSADIHRENSFAKRGQFDTKRGQFDTKRGHSVPRKVESEAKGTLPPSPLGDTLPSWSTVERHIVQSGVREWVRVLRFLKARVTPSHASEIVKVFEERRGAYGSVALYLRLMRAHPDLPPDEGWPLANADSDWCRAEGIRSRVHAMARKQSRPISDAVIAARVCELLDEAGLEDCKSNVELQLAATVEKVRVS